MLYVKSLLGDRDRSITLWLVLYYNVLKMSIYGKPWEVAGFLCLFAPYAPANSPNITSTLPRQKAREKGERRSFS